MFNLPFLQKNSVETERYILMLYLSGEKIYGFAFEENNSQHQSALYQEHVDPFLKDGAAQVEKIITNCERDLGENVYLKKTVLVLNSLYTTESGAIREDFLTQIKKLLKTVDLDNLGYLNFYEVVLHHFPKHKPFYFLEESTYDFTLYSIEDGAIKKTDKVAKSQDLAEGFKELRKFASKDQELYALLRQKPDQEQLPVKHLIVDEELPQMFIKVYFKDKKQNPTKEETVVSEGLPLAPGFGTEIVESDEFVPQEIKTKWQLPKLNFNWKMPNLPQKTLILAVPLLILLLIFTYYLFLHQATIILETKKENFSSDLSFKVSKESKFAKTFQSNVSVTASTATSGELVTGEKAKGEVTIYNGLFEKQELDEGDKFSAANGSVFIINSAVSVPAATTSANLGEGVVTKAFGKKNVNVVAASIGAEGNLDSGAKLTYEGFSADEFYALADSDFTGGVKKTVAVFSNRDAQNLEKKALTLSKNKLIAEFRQKYGSSNVLFDDTIIGSGVKKKYSAEIDDEIDKVSLSYEGEVKAFFAPYEQLSKMVQEQKLKDKEFVDDTFMLSNIKLLNQKNNVYSYTAIAKGKVQNFVDRQNLLKQLKGKLVFSAKKVLDNQQSIISYEVRTNPIPLPFLPVFDRSIKLQFAK